MGRRKGCNYIVPFPALPVNLIITKSVRIPQSVISFAEIIFMRIFLSCLLLVVLISCNNSQNEKKQERKVISKHSADFNSSVQSAMDSYHTLTEAFVNWDSGAVVLRSKELQLELDSINFFGFDPETITAPVDTLNLAKKDLQAMAMNKSITDKRHNLNSLTQHLYSFLAKVQYDEKKIYLQECPMAFNDTIPGDWLSEVDSIRNPYLGLHHPKYGSAMIECGSNKSTIDFTSAEKETRQEQKKSEKIRR